MLGLRASPLFPVPALPLPPRFPAPRCFFMDPHPWVVPPRWRVFFLRLFITMLHHPFEQVIDRVLAVTEGSSDRKRLFHSPVSISFSGRIDADHALYCPIRKRIRVLKKLFFHRLADFSPRGIGFGFFPHAQRCWRIGE